MENHPINADKKIFLSSSLLCTALAIVMSGIYSILRYPLDTDYFVLLKVLLISLAWINTPYLLFSILKNNSINFYYLNVLVIISMLIIFVVAGIFNMDVMVYAIIFLGIIASIITVFHYMKTINNNRLWHWDLFLIIILSVWISGLIWDGRNLSPLFLEKIVLGMYNSTGGLDNFFHMSIAQMIKTYNIPSTGLDGVPYIPYHYGSHFLFAQISKVLGISIIDMYHLGFPVIFWPLFFHVVFLVFHQFRSANSNSDGFNYLFWILLFIVFIGIFSYEKSGIAYRTSLAWNSILGSESYLVSMIFFVMALSMFAAPVIRHEKFKMNLTNVIFISIFSIIIGFTKISTLFIFDAILFYLYLRYRLYASARSTVFLFFVFIISLAIFYLFYDPLSKGIGTVDFLSFFKNYIHTSFPVFILFSFFWTFILIGIWFFLFINKIKVNTIFIELQIIIAFFGFLPGAFFKISGGSAYFFSDIQHYTALFFMSYYLNFYIPYIKEKTLRVVYAICFFLMIFPFYNCMYAFKRLVKENFVTKNCILGRCKYSLDFVKMRDLFNNPSIFLDKRLNDALLLNKDFIRMKFLISLDSLSHKERKILHFEDQDFLLKYLPCYKVPFLITAVTGISLFNGYSIYRCYYADFGVEHYRRTDSVSKEQNICKFLNPRIFREVVYCNITDRSYRVVECAE